MPTDIDRIAEAADNLKQRQGGLEAQLRDLTREGKEDRHRLAGFIQKQDMRIEAMAMTVAGMQGSISALKWAVATLIGLIVIGVGIAGLVLR
jgi:NCAIR mutase (PurE)-related protein